MSENEARKWFMIGYVAGIVVDYLAVKIAHWIDSQFVKLDNNGGVVLSMNGNDSHRSETVVRESVNNE